MDRFKILKIVAICVLCLITLNCCIDRDKYAPKPYVRALEIVKLSDNKYLHVSYLKDQSGGYVPCNGFLYLNENKAILFDTPINDTLTNQLFDFIKHELHSELAGVVINHYNKHAVNGLKQFNKLGIPSYGTEFTAQKLRKDSVFITNIFDTIQEVRIGDVRIENRYFGKAHKTNNIVSYIHNEHLLFGGCMIKSLDALKGNITGANLKEWSQTVSKVKDAYPNVKMVIPGHGAMGDSRLLDYTIKLFESEE